jgi:hypothetical protein
MIDSKCVVRGARQRRSRIRSATMAHRRPFATASPLAAADRDFPPPRWSYMASIICVGRVRVLRRQLHLPHAPAPASGCVVVPLHDMKWAGFAPLKGNVSVCVLRHKKTRARDVLCRIGCRDSGGCHSAPVEKSSRTCPSRVPCSAGCGVMCTRSKGLHCPSSMAIPPGAPFFRALQLVVLDVWKLGTDPHGL